MSGMPASRSRTSYSRTTAAGSFSCGSTIPIAERSKPELADAIRSDLGWLGISWAEEFHQSDRLERYEDAAERLRRAGRLYPCFESEEELRVKREMRIRRGKPPVYDRAMLNLTVEQRAAAEAGGKRPYWRFLLSDRTVAWQDLVGGTREVRLPSVSDPVLIRADKQRSTRSPPWWTTSKPASRT